MSISPNKNASFCHVNIILGFIIIIIIIIISWGGGQRWGSKPLQGWAGARMNGFEIFGHGWSLKDQSINVHTDQTNSWKGARTMGMGRGSVLSYCRCWRQCSGSTIDQTQVQKSWLTTCPSFSDSRFWPQDRSFEQNQCVPIRIFFKTQFPTSHP